MSIDRSMTPSTGDPQMAVYAATDCSDFNTFHFRAANDDESTTRKYSFTAKG